MSTAEVENAKAEQPATSSAQDELKDEVLTEEGAPATKAEEKKDYAEKKEHNGRGTRTFKDENGVLKTSPQKISENKRQNSKYDPSILPKSDDAQTIRNQVEFYFGDSNLPLDRFMWNETDGSNNLPIKIAKICTFGRMKRFADIKAVVAALRESEFLEVTGPEGLEEVNRKHAYEPQPRSKVELRSIYAKGFGDEGASSQFDIEAFFTPYGPINSVRLRRTEDKLFKGSVFVEFQDEELKDKFLKLDPKPLWKDEHPLKIMSKTEYNEAKVEEIRDGKMEPGRAWARGRGRGRGGRGGDRGGQRNDRDRGGRDRGDRDPDDWKKRREDDRANGFRDDRNRRDNKGGRGGRGRGRRDDRGPRNNDRNREREDHEDREDKNGDNSEKKAEKTENDRKGDATAQELKSDSVTAAPEVENSKKRARESDGENEIPAKKVDFKSDATAESS